jgi:hypothetical protein
MENITVNVKYESGFKKNMKLTDIEGSLKEHGVITELMSQALIDKIKEQALEIKTLKEQGNTFLNEYVH